MGCLSLGQVIQLLPGTTLCNIHHCVQSGTTVCNVDTIVCSMQHNIANNGTPSGAHYTTQYCAQWSTFLCTEVPAARACDHGIRRVDVRLVFCGVPPLPDPLPTGSCCTAHSLTHAMVWSYWATRRELLPPLSCSRRSCWYDWQSRRVSQSMSYGSLHSQDVISTCLAV